MDKKNNIAAVLSFLIPGLGQIFKGQIGSGFSIVAVFVSCSFLTAIIIGYPLMVIVWIWAVIDAYKEKDNAVG